MFLKVSPQFDPLRRGHEWIMDTPTIDEQEILHPYERKIFAGK